MNHERRAFGIAVLDGKIYAIGGSPDSLEGSFNERYDPKTDRWTTLTAMPTERCSHAVVACQGKIYCIGGSVPYFGPVFVSQGTDVVEVYDPINDAWSTKAPLPIKTGALSACVVNNQIFVINYDSTMYMYNPSTDKWSNKTSIPINTKNLTVRVMNNQIFAICSGETAWAMFMYNPATDTWIKKADPYVLHGIFEFIVVDNKIMICDRPMHVDNLTLSFRIYDTMTDKWSEGQTATKLTKNAILLVGETSGVYAPKKVYVFGWNQVNIDTFQPFTWVYDSVDDVWTTAKPISLKTLYSGVYSVVVVDDIFYVINRYGTVVEQYVPVGYNPQGYPNIQPSTTVDVTSHVPSEHTPFWSFLTGFALGIIFLTVGIIIAIYYCTKRKKQ